MSKLRGKKRWWILLLILILAIGCSIYIANSRKTKHFAISTIFNFIDYRDTFRMEVVNENPMLEMDDQIKQKYYYEKEDRNKIVNVYEYQIPSDTMYIKLAFDSSKRAKSYDEEGKYCLKDWTEDSPAGQFYLQCDVDADEDGEYDVLKIYEPIIDGEGNSKEGELLYVISFQPKSMNISEFIGVYRPYNDIYREVFNNPDFDSGGFKFIDENGTKHVTDLYTYTLPKALDEITICLSWDIMFLENYDAEEKNYLDCSTDDKTVGTHSAVGKLDSDKDGEYDVLVIRKPYRNYGYGNNHGGEVIAAITFRN